MLSRARFPQFSVRLVRIYSVCRKNLSSHHPINTLILKYRQLQAYTEKASPPKVVRFKMAIRIQKKSINAIKNRTEWSPIRSVIIQLITKFITSMIADRIGRHEVFLPINQKSYNSREWPAYMFVTSLSNGTSKNQAGWPFWSPYRNVDSSAYNLAQED